MGIITGWTYTKVSRRPPSAPDARRYRFAPWLLHKPPASTLDRF